MTEKRLLSKGFVLLLFVSGAVFGQADKTLWYRQPAGLFDEALVLGNGKLGATVFGGINTEQIYLNDATLWSGEPVDAGKMNAEAYKTIPAIREALVNEDYKQADVLQRKVQGKFSESFAPLGTMFLDFKHGGSVANYRRALSLADATATVDYTVDGVAYSRAYWVSHPDQVFVMKLTCGKAGMLNFNIRFSSLLKNAVDIENNVLKATGYAPIHAEPSYRGDVANAVIFDEQHGTRFAASISIKNTGGRIVATDNTLGLAGGMEAVVYVSITTSFNGFDKNPVTDGLDYQSVVAKQLKVAYAKEYSTLLKNHVADYQSFFNRVELDLGKGVMKDIPTDVRLKEYARTKSDKVLEMLYFNFGRYLLISSSRVPGVPANLQGIWNPYMRPPWSSNYTTNINVQENYWLAETTNLPEMHAPLMSFIRNVSQTGKATARNFYGVNGWTVAHNTDIWAMSNPVGNFGEGDPVWANWNMAGAWLSTHLWEHYTFNNDKAFLKEAYPVMKEAAVFCLEWMVRDKEGKFITSPSTSPENNYLTGKGYKGATLYGGTADLAMVRELLLKTILAATTLNIDADFRQQMQTALENLHPYHIGKKGNLQEWYYDWDDADPHHRHQSHLFGLFPGSHLSIKTTPELAQAVRRSLEIKGDATTGWSTGWRINLWARLGDGERAYKTYQRLLQYVEPDSSAAYIEGSGGTYPNLFDACPPFQIDGNFGGTAGVAEMLLQSTENSITLLPALPDAWSTGSVKGLKARGGFEVTFRWKNTKVTEAYLYSATGGVTRVLVNGRIVEVRVNAGQRVRVV